MPRLRMQIRWMALAAAWGSWAFSAHAQETLNELSQPPFTAHDVDRIALLLHLSAEQGQSLALVQRGMSESLKADVALARDAKAQSDGLSGKPEYAHAYDAYVQAMKQLTADWRREEDAFCRDLKSILDNQQLESWPAFERLHRRFLLRSAPVAGLTRWSHVNLVNLADAAELTAPGAEAIREALGDYEIELDVLLQGYEKTLKSTPADADEQRSADALHESVRLARGLSLVNQQRSRQIQALLPEEDARKMDAAVKQIVYGSIFTLDRPSGAYLAGAQGLSDLTAEQADAIKKLADAYAQESAEVDRQAFAAFDQATAAMFDAYHADLPFADWRKQYLPIVGKCLKTTQAAREALEARMLERAKVALTPEQQDRLKNAPRPAQ